MSDNGDWVDPSRQGDRPQPPPVPSGHDAGYGKPGVVPLRPLTVGEILDGAIATMRRHAALVFGVSAVVALIETGLSVAASIWLLSGLGNVPRPGPAATEQELLNYSGRLLGQTAATLGVTLAVTVLVRTFLTGFMTVVVGKAVLGKPITFGEAMTELKPRLLPLVGVTVLYTLMVTVGSMFCLIPGLWLYALFGLASPALVLEHAGIRQSLNRSRTLVQGAWWRVFGILLLTTLCAAVISLVIQIPFNLSLGFGAAGTDQLAGMSVGQQLLSGAGEVIAATLVGPFVAGATALLYIDQRMRKEGMDIQLARAAGTV
ncbi:MAG TPA: hypothetical protein VJT49_03720 [Amycolatopsis sp.]|uniref:hypothetical protein n=1 Tax=Amycolatopsis sp. TaxID=37632 RepID=UPI002B46CDC6|nr:hypothetical protein [Amycolatopsis sp.]HKS44218.1 hypothetical protein [Amycolatopsis sp.]